MEACPDGYDCLEGLCGAGLNSVSGPCMCGVPRQTQKTCEEYGSDRDLCLQAACTAGDRDAKCVFNVEANACGCPASTAPTPSGAEDFCQDVPSRDPDALATELSTLDIVRDATAPVERSAAAREQALCCVAGACSQLSLEECGKHVMDGTGRLLHRLKCDELTGSCDRTCSNYANCCNGTDPCRSEISLAHKITSTMKVTKDTLWHGQPFRAPADVRMGSFRYSVSGLDRSSAEDVFSFQLIKLSPEAAAEKVGQAVMVPGVAAGSRLPAVDFSEQDLSLTAGQAYMVAFKLRGEGVYGEEMVQREQPNLYWSVQTSSEDRQQWLAGHASNEQDLLFRATFLGKAPCAALERLADEDFEEQFEVTNKPTPQLLSAAPSTAAPGLTAALLALVLAVVFLD